MKRILLALIIATPVAAAEDPKVATVAANPLKAFIVDTQGKLFYGVFATKPDGKLGKVGWSVSDTHLGKLHDKEVAVSAEQVRLELNRSGDKVVIEITSTSYFSLEGDGNLVLHEEEMKEGKHHVKRKAVPNGDKLVITTDTNGRKEERTVALPKRTLGASLKLSEWLKATPKKGDTFDLWGIELEE